MAISSPYQRPAPSDDYTAQLFWRRPGYANADPGMVTQPYAEPSDRMPNVHEGNLNQRRESFYGGWRFAGGGGQNQLLGDPLGAYQASQLNALAAPGRQLMPGNIDLHNRPVVRNADGSISTVRSATITDDQGRAILIPTVIEGRGVVPVDQARRWYEQTGQHLGVFDSIEAADRYAQLLHEQQAQEYRR